MVFDWLIEQQQQQQQQQIGLLSLTGMHKEINLIAKLSACESIKIPAKRSSEVCDLFPPKFKQDFRSLTTDSLANIHWLSHVVDEGTDGDSHVLCRLPFNTIRDIAIVRLECQLSIRWATQSVWA